MSTLSSWVNKVNIKVNESRYIVLFVVSGSIKKLFLMDFVNSCRS